MRLCMLGSVGCTDRVRSGAEQRYQFADIVKYRKAQMKKPVPSRRYHLEINLACEIEDYSAGHLA